MRAPPPAAGPRGEADPFDPREALKHPDPAQLMFQIAEIFDEQTYLRNGIELKHGCVVLDVGANVGVAAAFFATRCGAAAVHSFEPLAPIYELLVANVGEIPACRTYPFGLSSTPGTAEFTYYPGATSMSGQYADPDLDAALVATVLRSSGWRAEDAEAEVRPRYRPERMSCEMRTLAGVVDDLGLADIDLLKIDVEKAEVDVLKGMNDRAWSAVRQMVVEVHDEGGRCAEVAGMLRARGFAVTFEQEPALRETDIHVAYATRDSTAPRELASP